MNHIDRLIMEVRRAAQGYGKGYGIGEVDHDPDTGLYTAIPHSWEGVKGSGNKYESHLPDWWCSDYDTHEAASNALCKLFSGFGIPDDYMVIYTINYV